MENKKIVNGALLTPRIAGKQVQITGLVTDMNNKQFTIRTSDNVLVTCVLKEPLDSLLDGYVEVHGIYDGKVVQATDLIVFSNHDFDIKGHNMLCNLLHSVPNLWKMKA